MLRFIATCTLIAAAALAAPADTYRACRVGNRLMVHDPRVELGIGMHDMSAQQIGLVRDLGIRLVRHTMYWYQIETGTQAGAYDEAALGRWDELVDRCDREGIILEVVVHGNAPGCGFANRVESYERFARFMGDMASRFASVRYWELFNEMDVAFTDLFGAQDAVPMVQRGRMYAEMLKLAYPAIKAANPRAFVLTGGMTDTGDFPRGIYEGGGREYFDIMNIHTYGVPVVWAFVDRGMQVRQTMARNGDGPKPLWNTEFGIDAGNLVGAWGYPHDGGEEDGPRLDELMLQQWEACLDAAEKYELYQKILPYQLHAGNERDDNGDLAATLRLPVGHTVDDYGFGILRRDGNTPRPVYTWLKQRDFNRPILQRPQLTADVEFWDPEGLTPVGYEPNRWRPHYVNLPGVVVDSAYPTTFELTARE